MIEGLSEECKNGVSNSSRSWSPIDTATLFVWNTEKWHLHVWHTVHLQFEWFRRDLDIMNNGFWNRRLKTTHILRVARGTFRPLRFLSTFPVHLEFIHWFTDNSMFRYLSLSQSALNSMDLLQLTRHTSRDFWDWNRIRLFVTIHPNTIKESSRASNKGDYIEKIRCDTFHKIHFLLEFALSSFFILDFHIVCCFHFVSIWISLSFLISLNSKWYNPHSLITNIRNQAQTTKNTVSCCCENNFVFE